ncbi:hypothetical protein AAG906_029920 [Vitis piasezkii]
MAVMDHIESCWEVLSGEIPLTISYPAKDGMQWQIETGYDPKKTSWSYHHGEDKQLILQRAVGWSNTTGRLGDILVDDAEGSFKPIYQSNGRDDLMKPLGNRSFSWICS